MLKPNLNTADPFPASSDLEFAKAMVELTYEQGAKMTSVLSSQSSELTCIQEEFRKK